MLLAAVGAMVILVIFGGAFGLRKSWVTARWISKMCVTFLFVIYKSRNDVQMMHLLKILIDSLR